MEKIVIIIRERDAFARVRAQKVLRYLEEHYVDYKIIKLIGRDDKELYQDCLAMPESKIRYSQLLQWLFFLIRFIRIVNSDKSKIVAIGFESAIPFAIFLRNSKTRLIFDNPDNAFLLFEKGIKRFLLRFAERFVVRQSLICIVPSETRRFFEGNYFILKNFPYQQSFNNRVDFTDGKLHILVNGWVNEARGLRHLEVVKSNQDILDYVHFHFVGKNSSQGWSNCIHHGVLNEEDSFAIYKKCHFVLSLYDPMMEINRLACPNKWGDAIATKCVPITNNGVTTLGEYFPAGGDIRIDYSDDGALLKLLLKRDEMIALYKRNVEILASYDITFWKDRYEVFFKGIQSS